jgi:hypothetical protein
MPRTRPLRTKEEIAQVPPEKSVTLDLSPQEEIDGQNPFEVEESQETQTGTRPTKGADRISARAPSGTSPKDAGDSEDVSDLKRQLDDMRKAQEESERRVNREIQARQEAERLVQEREREVSSSRARADDAEYDAILNAIGAAEAEADKAQQDLAIAGEAGDHKAAADANRRIARAESRLAQLQDGKDAIERQKTAEAARIRTERENPPERRQEKQPTVEEYIDQLPNLLQSQKDWLKAHPDTISNPRVNTRLQAAHFEAEDQGMRPGTKGYFQYLEERLGFSEPEEEEEENVKTPVSAPPSRAATNPSTGRQSNNRITLTPEQREMARLSGIDELTYARQLQRMNELKANGVIN